MRKIGTAIVRAARFSAALLSSTIMLSACGGGGSDTSAPSAPQSDNTTEQAVLLKAADYRPAQVNDRLVYSEIGSNASEPNVYTTIIKEQKTVDGVDGLAVESYWNGYTGQVFDHIGMDGWTYEIDTNITTTPIHKIKILPATFKIGDKFVMGDEMKGAPGQEGRFHLDATISGLDTITTPAGTFLNCVKVSVVETRTFTSTDYDGSIKTETIKNAHAVWYAPGVGRIFFAFVDIETQASRPAQQLVAYQINGVRNENVRPVASLGPGPNESNHGRFDTITLQFNEPMQEMTLNTLAAIITDPEGNVIPGEVTFTDTTWTFRPNYQSLKISGQYQIQLTELATDQAGNAVMPATWSFFVDVTPPQLVKADFIDGQIILTFDEEFIAMPELSRVIFFSKTEEGTFIFDLSKSQFSIESNRITLGIKGGRMDLKYGATYHVYIDNNGVGLIDLANNFTPRDIATITIPAGPY